MEQHKTAASNSFSGNPTRASPPLGRGAPGSPVAARGMPPKARGGSHVQQVRILIFALLSVLTNGFVILKSSSPLSSPTPSPRPVPSPRPPPRPQPQVPARNCVTYQPGQYNEEEYEAEAQVTHPFITPDHSHNEK